MREGIATKRILLLASVAFSGSLAVLALPSAALAQDHVIEGPDTFAPVDAVVNGQRTVAETIDGKFTIWPGVTFSSKDAFIAVSDGVQGTVIVSGADAKWLIDGDIMVADEGEGTLAISDGGFVTVEAVKIGNAAGGDGLISVTGSASRFETTGAIAIGEAAKGTLTIFDGAYSSTTVGHIGLLAGGDGRVEVSGAGSRWDLSDYMSIGLEGTGTLSIKQGGVVDTTLYVIVGGEVDGVGELIVAGAGSTLTTLEFVRVGDFGRGRMRIESGGSVLSKSGTVAADLGSDGGVVVTGIGSNWTINDHLSVGHQGEGRLDITNGAVGSADSTELGRFAEGNGVLQVLGAGSTLNTETLLMIGREGSGRLVVAGGGVVRAENSYLADVGTGSALVGGAGSAWHSTLSAHFEGQLDVVSGGLVTAEFASIGDYAKVDGAGSSMAFGTSLDIGMGNFGSLVITNGAKVSAGYATVGRLSTGIGILNVEGAGSTFEITDAFLAFGQMGAGLLRVSDGALLRVKNGAGAIHLGADELDNATLAIGGTSTSAATAAGTVEAGSIDMAGVNATVVLNHTAPAYVLSANLMGAGTVLHQAGHTTFSGDNTGFTGTMNVTGGHVKLASTMGGSAVFRGSTLSGVGGVGNLTLGMGAIITPGNSIGTINVAGNVVFEPGSTYRVEVDAAGTASDLIAARGTVTIMGGKVQHVGAAANYRGASRYQIITAAGGILGSGFDGVTTDFAFLDANLEYDAKAVYLNLTRNDVDFSTIGLTPNQKATGGGLGTIGTTGKLYDSFIALDIEAARAAFDQLSGDAHGSFRTAMVEDAQSVRSLTRLRARDLSTAQKGIEIWGEAFGAMTALKTDRNAASLRDKNSGVWIGADAIVGKGLVLGLAASRDEADYHVNPRGAKANRDGYGLAAYGSAQMGGFELSLGAAGSWQDVKSVRHIGYGNLSERLNAAYDVNTTQAFAEASYAFAMTHGSVSPYAAVARVRVDADAFNEAGGVAALEVEAVKQDVTFVTLGLGAQQKFAYDNGRSAMLGGRLGWRTASGDRTAQTRQSFGTGDTFVVDGLPVEGDVFVGSVSGQVRVSPRSTVFADWNGMAGKRTTSQQLSVGVSLSF